MGCTFHPRNTRLAWGLLGLQKDFSEKLFLWELFFFPYLREGSVNRELFFFLIGNFFRKILLVDHLPPTGTVIFKWTVDMPWCQLPHHALSPPRLPRNQTPHNPRPKRMFWMKKVHSMVPATTPVFTPTAHTEIVDYVPPTNVRLGGVKTTLFPKKPIPLTLFYGPLPPLSGPYLRDK